MQPWKKLTEPDDIEVISPEGQVRCVVKGYYSGSQFVIDDMKADVRAGDEIRRKLPNGKDDVFLVEDPKFFRDGHFGSHYQVKVSRRGSFDHHTGGNFNIRVSGNNSRVNVGSTDNSTNVVTNNKLFSDVRHTIASGVSDEASRIALNGALAELEHAQSKDTFAKAYQNFIALAADHIAVLTPFLPAITQLLTQWS
jgi:hypothetical protein